MRWENLVCFEQKSWRACETSGGSLLGRLRIRGHRRVERGQSEGAVVTHLRSSAWTF